MQSFQEASPANIRSPGGKWTALCLALLLMAGAEFLVRGPVRAIRSATQFNDFLSPYIQGNAWIRGLDPYSPQVLLKLWPAEALHFDFLPKEVANGTLVANRGIPTAYPITALVLVAPFSLLPWNVAYALWLAINLALFSATLCVLVSLAGVSYREPAGILLIAASLALAPFHTGIVTGNVSLAAIELSVAAIWAARGRHDITTAVLLAISAGLKPQIGLCFLLYYLMRRRWRIVGITLAMLGGLAALGLLRLELGHTPWLANYLNDNRVLFETGVLGNFTSINPTRFGLINLQVALYPLLGSVRAANGVAMSVGVIFLVMWLIGTGRRGSHGDFELLDLGAIAVISLLPIYHRFYDAALLVLPLCWVIVSFRKARMSAVFSLLLMLPFLIPGGTLLETSESSGRIPSALAHHWWWEKIVMPHQVWLLLLLSVLLLWEMSMNRASPGEQSNKNVAIKPGPIRTDLPARLL
ncbi:MAG: glycosyltransferase family 87 protein [Candidatus Sulfotelmatobacter sp.]